ncbi:MAG: kelch repeat-containing protein [Candidatus Omnitrophota bacterium]
MKTSRPHREEDGAARKAQKASVLTLLRAILSPESPATGLAQDTYLMHDIGELVVDPPQIVVMSDYAYAVFDTLRCEWSDAVGISHGTYPDARLVSVGATDNRVFRVSRFGNIHELQLIADGSVTSTAYMQCGGPAYHAGLPGGRVVSVVGCGGNVCRATVYDTATERGRSLVQRTEPCEGDTVETVIADERAVYVFSGNPHGGHVNFVAIDLASGAIKELAPRPRPIFRSAVVIAGQKIWFLGGEHRGVRVRAIAAYDIARDAWSVCSGGLKQPRSGASAVAIAGNIWIVGGTVDHGRVGLKFAGTIEMYDPKTGRCTEMAGVPDQLGDTFCAAVAI